MTLSTQDVRHHHSYLADLVVTPVYSNLLRHIRHSLSSLPPGKVQLISKSHPLHAPIQEYARGILGIHYLVLVRIGLGVATLPQITAKEAKVGTTVIWKKGAYRPEIHDYVLDQAKIAQVSLREQFPDDWQNISAIQLLSSDEEESAATPGTHSGERSQQPEKTPKHGSWSSVPFGRRDWHTKPSLNP